MKKVTLLALVALILNVGIEANAYQVYAKYKCAMYDQSTQEMIAAGMVELRGLPEGVKFGVIETHGLSGGDQTITKFGLSRYKVGKGGISLSIFSYVDGAPQSDGQWKTVSNDEDQSLLEIENAYARVRCRKFDEAASAALAKRLENMKLKAENDN